MNGQVLPRHLLLSSWNALHGRVNVTRNSDVDQQPRGDRGWDDIRKRLGMAISMHVGAWGLNRRSVEGVKSSAEAIRWTTGRVYSTCVHGMKRNQDSLSLSACHHTHSLMSASSIIACIIAAIYPDAGPAFHAG